MTFMEWANSLSRKFTVADIALIKASCFAGGILLAQHVPALRRMDSRVVGAVMLLLAVKPVMTVFSDGFFDGAASPEEDSPAG